MKSKTIEVIHHANLSEVTKIFIDWGNQHQLAPYVCCQSHLIFRALLGPPGIFYENFPIVFIRPYDVNSVPNRIDFTNPNSFNELYSLLMSYDNS